MVNFHSIEKKWQKIWETKKAFKTKETQNKYYVLEMFPYPSGYGIHMGHAENYSIGDVMPVLKGCRDLIFYTLWAMILLDCRQKMQQ